MRDDRTHISVVVPVYGSPQSLEELCSRIHASLSPLTSFYEVILVNDASPDNSWEIIEQLHRSDQRVLGLNLSRNFGQHPAISAGLAEASGEWVVVMDCDLQDQPEEIPRLYHEAQQGFEQVVAVRAARQDTWFKRQSSSMYARLLSYLSGQRVNPAVGNFGIYHWQVIDVINSMPEQGRTFGLLALWAGFRRTELAVEHAARPYGRSSYTFRGLVRQALIGVISHSDKPLKLTVKVGALVSMASFVGALVILVRAFFGASAAGWPSLMVMLAFMTGVILGSVGVVGLYVGRVLDESKRRPTYVVWKTTGDQPDHPPRSTEGSGGEHADQRT
jgi:dolichol-phosphate mannosyltransferase